MYYALLPVAKRLSTTEDTVNREKSQRKALSSVNGRIMAKGGENGS
jgi:hypothetical protein